MFRNCVFWIGVVENNNDPQKRGRVQVRVFGAHDIYNPPMTDAQGRTSWTGTYAGASSGIGSSSGSSTSSGNMPSASANGNKLFIWQRYNNPMNLKNVNGSWRRFDDISQAYPAYYAQLVRYNTGKTTGTPLTTPAAMISVWAPPNENKTQEYINNVHKWTGLDMYSPIDMNNLDDVAKMLRGMTIMESSQDFSEADIKAAIQGNIVPSMTDKSTLYKDEKLYTGSSNAAQNIPYEPPTSGAMPTKPSGNMTTQNTPAQVPQKSGSLPSSGVTRGNDNTGHKLPTEDLPWAICLYSAVDYGGTSYSTLPAPQVQNGAWVFGMSIDGDFMNQLFILGIIPNLKNIDALSKNPQEANAQGLGSQAAIFERQKRNMPSADVSLNGKITFQQLLDGVWNAESSRSTNKKVSSAYCYGAMQLMPAAAAGYLLEGAGTDAFTKAGWTIDDETTEMLKYIRYAKRNGTTGFWGSSIVEAQQANPKVKEFCDLLHNNDTLNMAIGAAYLRDCSSSSQGNGDPVLTALYYNQGVPNVRKIMNAIGVSSYNKIPDDMSYSDFIDKVNAYIKPRQNNDFRIYTDNIFQSVGGVENLEKTRRTTING